MKKTLVLIFISLLMLTDSNSTSWASVKERHDIAVPNPTDVFKRACQDLSETAAHGLDLSKNKYYIHTVKDDSYNELMANHPFMLVMIEDSSSADSYYIALYQLPEMEGLYYISGLSYTPPFDDFFERVINLYANMLYKNELGEDGDVYFEEDEDDYVDNDAEMTWEEFFNKHKGKYTHNMSQDDLAMAKRLFIEYIKESYLNNFPPDDDYKPIGAAFEKYFSKPKWELYTTVPRVPYNGLYGVKFTGVAKYNNVNARYEIWFHKFPEDSSFESFQASYSAVNDRQTSLSDILALIYLN